MRARRGLRLRSLLPLVLVLRVAAPIAAVHAAPPARPVQPAAPAATPAKPAAEPEPDGTAVRVRIETVVVDRNGTRTLEADEADLVPGAVGVLRKEITLVGRDPKKTKEPVIVEARLDPSAAVPEGMTCALATVLETRRAGRAGAAAGATRKDDRLDRRETTLLLGSGEQRMMEAYASPVTGGRIALRFQCAPALPAADAIPAFVTIDLEIEKSAEGEATEILRDQRLVAAIGREASTVVSANTTLPEGPGGAKRYRRDRVEAILTPVVLTAGRLQIEVRVRGDATTQSSDAPPSMASFDRAESYLVASGERRTFTIDVPAAGPDEGWSKLVLRVDVIARF